MDKYSTAEDVAKAFILFKLGKATNLGTVSYIDRVNSHNWAPVLLTNDDMNFLLALGYEWNVLTPANRIIELLGENYTAMLDQGVTLTLEEDVQHHRSVVFVKF